MRLTSVIARIVMDRWLSLFLTRVTDAGAVIHLIAKYVDDVNLVLAGLQLGTRWTKDGLIHSPKLETEDRESGETVETVTIECMRSAADSVVPWLQFTSDSPCRHASRTVPILYLQVRVRHPDPAEEGLGSDLLAW